MPSELFQSMGSQQGGQQNPMQALQALRQNPAAFLRQFGKSIPAGMSQPNEIIQHLLQSGQIPQNAVQMAQQRMRGMFRR